MYRDSANALDEHDRAVGAILISEALIDECEKARAVVLHADVGHTERWRTLTGIHDTYPEVWRHLDRARKELAIRGANTASYDEHRPSARRAATNAEGTDIELAAIDDARRAVEELKLAVPGADWLAIKKRTAGLLRVKLARPRGQRASVLVLLSLFAIALITWSISIIPERKEDPRHVMRRELSEVSSQRKVKISMLQFELGMTCDLVRARELTKLLAFDGRWNEAATFGKSYMSRCGDDSVVDNWANAPVPKHF
jgi:hypothetical protein